jgi:hypothetical protein
MSKKTKEPSKRANHKENIKFLNPLSCCEKQIKEGKGEESGPPERRP